MLAIECAALAKPVDAVFLKDRALRSYDRFAADRQQAGSHKDRVIRNKSEPTANHGGSWLTTSW
ncbi:hypothetical protein [Pseudomonas batumici]|uniref:Uncharacterized protein n=1 Tax=Pseudomonas batumici TaxID=226910 RepID=A0A0C2HV86_9PSED|nr:hypothetical protein [Pseudomonas batumici]KIH81111.1 hypothetical protein UCMB321_5409 [Pseudomonas batumici]